MGPGALAAVHPTMMFQGCRALCTWKFILDAMFNGRSFLEAENNFVKI